MSELATPHSTLDASKRTVAVAVLFAIHIAGAAVAQSRDDFPAFAGWRVGASVGGSFASQRITNVTSFGMAPLGPFESGQTFRPGGQPFGEIRLGYDLPIARSFILGVEGSVEIGQRASARSGVSLSQFEAQPSASRNYSVAIDVARDLTSLASFRARAGYAPSQRLLAFATAGVAVAKSRLRLRQSGNFTGLATAGFFILHVGGDFPTTEVNRDAVVFAPVFGGGLEYALNANWSLRAEYSIAYYGDARLSAPTTSGTPSLVVAVTPTLASSTAGRSTLRALTAGVDYRF